MGVVYEAERESLKAHVALKVLHSRCADGSLYRARFRNEARSAARMPHEHRRVFDFGEHEGILYYAMQYISARGSTVLRDVQRARRASVVQTRRCLNWPGGGTHTGKYLKVTTPGEIDLAHLAADLAAGFVLHFSQGRTAPPRGRTDDSDPTSSAPDQHAGRIRPVAAPATARSPDRRAEWPMRLDYTGGVCCTATSSRRTCCSMLTAPPG